MTHSKNQLSTSCGSKGGTLTLSQPERTLCDNDVTISEKQFFILQSLSCFGTTKYEDPKSLACFGTTSLEHRTSLVGREDSIETILKF